MQALTLIPGHADSAQLLDVPEPPDVSDALAVALCHYYAQKLPG